MGFAIKEGFKLKMIPSKELREKIENIMARYTCNCAGCKEHTKFGVDELLTLISQQQVEAVKDIDSMLVELWNFFALEKDHHGKQRTCGGIPSLMKLHYFLKKRGLIKGSGQFSDKGLETKPTPTPSVEEKK